MSFFQSVVRRSFRSISGSEHRNDVVRSNSIKKTDHDDEAVFDTYVYTWKQLDEVVTKNSAQQGGTILSDDIALTVTCHLEHLVVLLGLELNKNQTVVGSSACLDHFLKHNILSKICSWCLDIQHDELLMAVAKSIDSILASAKKGGNKDLSLLRDPSIHGPICQMFKRYEVLKECDKTVPAQFESYLLSVSYYICVFLVREPSFLDVFYDIATIESHPKFPMMTLLTANLYQNGAHGQTSRDNLKLLISLAKEQQLLAQFIALQSDFCPIVATGLSAVYSDLPRLLPNHVEKAGMLSALDIESIKEVEVFVTSLEFCDSILETASWLIAGQLLDFCYSGFLVPVLGSALFQDLTGLNVKLLDSPVNVNTMKEILAATCYLTLCIRRIRNRGLIGIFVRFLLVHTHEGTPIIEFLIERMGAQSDLRLATLHLFHALIELDCEDIMLVLMMKHILPCSHVMVSQRGAVLQERDTNCLWAAKFLSLVPIACSSRAFQRSNSPEIEQHTLQEMEPPSRIRSWSRTSNDSGDNRYGQLAFTSSDKKSPEQMALNEHASSKPHCQHLRNYLNDEPAQIRSCFLNCRPWTYLYNGNHPPISDAVRMLQGTASDTESTLNVVDFVEVTDSNDLHLGTGKSKNAPSTPEYSSVNPADVYSYCMAQLTTCLNEMNNTWSTSPGQSSGYQSFNFSLRPQDPFHQEGSFFSKDVQDDLEFWSLMRDDDLDYVPPALPNVTNSSISETHTCSVPSTGPFLETLIKSIDGWLSNNLEVNLALCSIISRLAAYSQPLLRSLLLNPYLVLQPTIPSLTLSIATLKQRIDTVLRVNDNTPALLEEARHELASYLIQENKSEKSSISNSTKGDLKQRPSSKFAGLFSSLVRRDAAEVIKEESVDLNIIGNGNRFSRRVGGADERSDPIGSHVALCAVLLEEWLHELAALSLEHAVFFTPGTIPIANV